MKHITPLGDRILVQRIKVKALTGDKIAGSDIIIAPSQTQESDTELAEVVYVPEHSFADKQLIERSEKIIEAQTNKAENGDPESLVALLQFNRYLKIKSIQPGDKVFISKYVGTTFRDTSHKGELTMVNGEDIVGIVSE